MALAIAGVGSACRTAVGPRPVEPGAPSHPAVVDDDPWAALQGFCDGIAPPDEAERAGHRERARTALRDAGHGWLVTEPGPTMQHLAGIRWGRSERPFLMALPAEGEPLWVVPAFEERTAREQLGDAAEVHTWQEHQSPYTTLAKAMSGRGRGEGPVALETELRHFVAEGLREALPKGRAVDGSAVVEAVRMYKQPPELGRLRRANEATKAALRLVASTGLPEGVRQSELAERIRAAQIRAGLSDVWVLALFGPNASFPHGTAEDRALAPGDVVLVDTGGSLHGYRSDISRTWVHGTPSDELRRAFATVVEAQRAALDRIHPGTPCGEVDAAARAVIEAAGFGSGYERFTHRLGHGIGLQVHEHPYLVRGSKRVLAPGMTMSDEPGIYVPGRFGVRIEDIVAVTEDGHEVFGPMVESLDEPL